MGGVFEVCMTMSSTLSSCDAYSCLLNVSEENKIEQEASM